MEEGSFDSGGDVSSDFSSDVSADSSVDYDGDLANDEGIDLGSDYSSDVSSDIGSEVSNDSSVDYGGDLANDEGIDLNSDYSSDVSSDFNSDTSMDYGDDLSGDNGVDLNADVGENTEYEDLSGGEVVYEPDSDGYQESEAMEPSSEIMTEDPINYNLDNASIEEKADAEQFMADNPELFSESNDTEDTELSTTDTGDDSYYHNSDAESITFGRYGDENRDELPDSYRNVAIETDSAYFYNDDYNRIQQEVGYTDDEMYEQSGNKEVVVDALSEGKDVQFSHDPREASGGLGREWDTIQDQTGSTVEDLTVGEDGRMHLTDYNSYSADYNEQPPYNPEDYE